MKIPSVVKCICVCAAVTFAPSVWAAPTEIYVVDVPRVLQESVPGKALRKNLEAETKKREARLQKDKLELQKMREDLGKQSGVLSNEALLEKQRSFERREKEFARKLQDEREDLGKYNGEQLGKLVKEIDVVVKELAKQQGYPLVIEKDQRIVLYVDDQFDITEQVIEAVNKRKIGI
ncbi:MAG: OmpH family outer membrane protein [Bdellovibrionota bacterium]|nr:MAG: OmpH family outer membrane protein [Bdellovibrionota bacterium]